MTPDPTTRDPAASLRELIAQVGTTSGGDYLSRVANGERIAIACGHWVRDAAPALLAEVERLRHDLRALQAFHDGQCEAREAAEQVAREAVRQLDLYRKAINRLDDMTEYAREEVSKGELRNIFAWLTENLAHHGARTGDSNEG